MTFFRFDRLLLKTMLAATALLAIFGFLIRAVRQNPASPGRIIHARIEDLNSSVEGEENLETKQDQVIADEDDKEVPFPGHNKIQ